MVCVVAFFVLCILGIFSARFRKPLKKAWACVTKKVRLQKCETGFKDDVKNSVLAKVVMKKPGLVKPLGITMEVLAVLLVFVMAWSLAEVVKGGAALIVFGTCNVKQPSACVLGTGEACSIDKERLGFAESIKTFQLHVFIGNWFKEFGEVFSAIPARFTYWEALEYMPDAGNFYHDYNMTLPMALKILDPGCKICRDSYLNELDSGFMDRYNLVFMVYPIRGVEEDWQFKNSHVVARYIEAVRFFDLENNTEEVEGKLTADWAIIHRLFSEYDGEGRQYQDAFNASYNSEEAEKILQEWLKEFGYSEEEVVGIVEKSQSGEVKATIETNMNTVDNVIKTKMIPTMIYDGKRHTGLYKP